MEMKRSQKVVPLIKDEAPSSEHEQTVIGGLIILTNKGFEKVRTILTVDDFYSEAHRVIYSAIAELSADGKYHDIMSVADLLEKRGELEDAGGLQYLGALARDTPSTALIEHYAMIVKRRSLERQRRAAAAKNEWERVPEITAAIKKNESGEKVDVGLSTINDILARKSEHDWLIRGWIERHQTVVLFGQSQSYKSLLAIDLACCIATGQPWRGQDVKQGAVLYVVGEGAGSGLTRRFKAWEIVNQTPLIDTPILVQESATVLPDDAERLIAESQSILLSKGWTLELVILDTLNRTMAGDERDSGDFSKYQRALDRVKQKFDCAALYIHHTGHADKSRERGVSEIGCNADVRMAMEIIGEKTRRLHAPKVKDADTPSEMIFTLASVEISPGSTEGQPVTSVVLRQLSAVGQEQPISTQQRRMLKLLADLYQHHREALANTGHNPDMARVGEDEWKAAMQAEIKDKGQRSRIRTELFRIGAVTEIEEGFVQLTAFGEKEASS